MREPRIVCDKAPTAACGLPLDRGARRPTIRAWRGCSGRRSSAIRRACSWPSATPAGLAQADLRRGAAARRRAGTGADRARAVGRAAGDDPLRQWHRSCAAHARRPHRRHSGGADLGRLFAAEPGPRQAQAHRRAARRPAWSTSPTPRPFAKALAALDLGGVEIVASRNGANLEGVTRFDRAGATADPAPRVEQAAAAIRADTIAKFLFTSGSTGLPKGVVNTHGMLTANQQQLAQIWPFLDEAAAGAARLAAVEPHLRRQPQFQSGAAPCRHALHRRRPAGARPDRADGAQSRARSRRRSISTCRRAMRRCCRSSSATRRWRARSSPSCA